MGWAVTIVVGALLGVTSYWHGRAGGAGTTGRAALLTALVVVALVVVGGVLRAVVRRVMGRREDRETEERQR